MIFDRHPEYRERYNRHFWARGYYCERVGNVNEETIKKYIEEQYERDRQEGDSEKQQQRAAFKRPPVTEERFARPPLGGTTNFAPEGLTQTTSRAGGTDLDEL